MVTSLLTPPCHPEHEWIFLQSSIWEHSGVPGGSKINETVGTSVRPGLQEFLSLKPVFAQILAISQLPFKYSYQCGSMYCHE